MCLKASTQNFSFLLFPMNQDVAAYPNKTELKFIYTCCKQNIEKDISFG